MALGEQAGRSYTPREGQRGSVPKWDHGGNKRTVKYLKEGCSPVPRAQEPCPPPSSTARHDDSRSCRQVTLDLEDNMMTFLEPTWDLHSQ